MSEKSEDTLSSVENGEEARCVNCTKEKITKHEKENVSNEQTSEILYISKEDTELDTLNQCVICLEDYGELYLSIRVILRCSKTDINF